MSSKFLCGCDPDDEHVKRYMMTLVPDGRGGQILSNKRFNSRGDEVCPIHGVVLKGSAYPVMRGPQGNDIPDHRADFKRRYGKPKRELSSSVEDKRDNRDPVAVGMEILAERNGGE